jgi:hypothetical protein
MPVKQTLNPNPAPTLNPNSKEPRRKLRVLVALTRRGKSPESFELTAHLPESTAKTTTWDLIGALQQVLRMHGLMGEADMANTRKPNSTHNS